MEIVLVLMFLVSGVGAVGLFLEVCHLRAENEALVRTIRELALENASLYAAAQERSGICMN